MKHPCKRLTALLLAAALSLTMAACSKAQPVSEEIPVNDAPAASMTADPQRAVEEIYKEIDIKEVEEAGDTLMEDTLGFDLTAIDEYYVRYSSGRYGLADVYIIKPAAEESAYDTVREQLEEIRYDRIASTESFDVLDAHKIAQNSEIFQYGGYLIMLMLADNTSAESVIERYLPSTEIVIDPAAGASGAK